MQSQIDKLWNKLYFYMSLMRLTKPFPILLLIFPAFWSISLNSNNSLFTDNITIVYTYVAFLLGGILVRSIGCIINDIADRKIDAKVDRTKNRMIVSKKISVLEAVILIIILSLLAFLILLTFNAFTLVLGCISAILIIIYPLTKRFTYYPQVFLGITFSFGVLMGQTALDGYLSIITILVYLACIFWIIGYDSIYAIQDYEYDKKEGIKSIVVALEYNIQAVVGYCYLATCFLLFTVGFIINASFAYYVILLLVMLHFIWQVVHVNLHLPKDAAKIFDYNIYVGLLIWIAFLIR